MLVVKRYALPPELLAIASVIFVPLLLVLGALMVTLQVAISLGSDAILQVTIVTLAIVQWSVPVFACWVFLGGLVLASRSLLRKERSIRPVGDETPSGERWVVESLAARQARDGTAAFRLAVRTVSAMPPERVLVALARTVSLRKAHVRLGFRLGEGNRVYRETLAWRSRGLVGSMRSQGARREPARPQQRPAHR